MKVIDINFNEINGGNIEIFVTKTTVNLELKEIKSIKFH